MTTFGTQLRKIRLERGLSISELADKIGYRRQAIYMWENGKGSPKSFSTILTVADFFHVSPDYFSNSHDTNLCDEVIKLRDEVTKLRNEVNSLRQSLTPVG